jgi:hypothetical protein
MRCGTHLENALNVRKLLKVSRGLSKSTIYTNASTTRPLASALKRAIQCTRTCARAFEYDQPVSLSGNVGKMFSRYVQLAKEAAVPPHLRAYCPRPRCATFVKLTAANLASSTVRCPACRHLFCARSDQILARFPAQKRHRSCSHLQKW